MPWASRPAPSPAGCRRWACLADPEWLSRQATHASERHRAACARLGWPEVVVPTQARVLALLAASGRPLSHAEIARGLGKPLYRQRGVPGGRNGEVAKHLRRLAVPLRLRRDRQGLVVVLPPRPGTHAPLYAVAPWLLARRRCDER